MDSYNAAVNIATKAIVDSIKENGKFAIKNVASRLSEALKSGSSHISSGARNSAGALLSVSMGNGCLPSLSGILATTYAAYTLNKSMGKTTEERIATTRTFLIMLSSSPYFALAVTKNLEKMFNKPLNP